MFLPEGATVANMEALEDPQYLAAKCLICKHFGAQHIACRVAVSVASIRFACYFLTDL